MPDLGSITELLRHLTKKNEKFIRSRNCQEHFNKLKETLIKPPILAYFEPSRKIQLVADVNPVALGAVLIQFDNQQHPRIISFASRSLSEVERRYSQTEKESLALVWGVERFYFYLAGLEFELITDYKPLEAIFKPSSKPLSRIGRWILKLQSFNFKIIYKPGNIADSVSRLCKITQGPFDQKCEQHVFTIIEKNTPKAMKVSQIISESSTDTELNKAIKSTIILGK